MRVSRRHYLREDLFAREPIVFLRSIINTANKTITAFTNPGARADSSKRQFDSSSIRMLIDGPKTPTQELQKAPQTSCGFFGRAGIKWEYSGEDIHHAQGNDVIQKKKIHLQVLDEYGRSRDPRRQNVWRLLEGLADMTPRRYPINVSDQVLTVALRINQRPSELLR